MWQDFAFSGIVAGAAWLLAAFVLRDRPERAINRSLAGLLAAEGLLVLTLFHAGAPEAEHHEAVLLAVGIGAGWSVVLLDLLFLGTIGAPLTRAFGHPRVRRLLLALLAVAWVHSLVLAAYHLATREAIGPWGNAMDMASGVCALAASLVSLAAGVSALKAAPQGSLARSRARAYIVAFGARDLGLALGIAVGLFLIPVWHAGSRPPEWAELVSRSLPRLGSLVYATALAAAILRVQVLDLGLRARLSVSRSSLSAFLLGLCVMIGVVFGAILDVPATWLLISLAVLVIPLHLACGRAATRLVVALRLRESLDERRRALRVLATEDDCLLPRFQEEHELGRGSEGRAFRAWDGVLERRVVVKEPWVSQGAAEAALAEARGAARVDHPNVVRIHDIILKPRIQVVFEHVDGETLDAFLAREGPVPPEHASRVLLDLLEGAAAIHRAGLVHGDIKPSNILLGIDGRARLLDFGIAVGSGRASRGAGTAGYASPEHARGVALDARSDIYALGRTLSDMLAGGAPPRSTQVVNAPTPAPGRPERPTRLGPLDDIALVATKFDREERYQSAEEMKRAILAANSSLPKAFFA